jgi:hypothetical protein
MIGNDIIVSYDPRDDEFFISDGYKHYVLTSSGLAETSQVVTSVIVENGLTIGIAKAEDYLDTAASFTIGELDYEVRGQKLLSSVEIGGDVLTGGHVGVSYKHDKAGSFTESSLIPLNKEGVAVTRFSGIEHRINASFPDFNDVKVDYVKINRKYSDKRYIRGPYASDDAEF